MAGPWIFECSAQIRDQDQTRTDPMIAPHLFAAQETCLLLSRQPCAVCQKLRANSSDLCGAYLHALDRDLAITSPKKSRYILPIVCHENASALFTRASRRASVA